MAYNQYANYPPQQQRQNYGQRPPQGAPRSTPAYNGYDDYGQTQDGYGYGYDDHQGYGNGPGGASWGYEEYAMNDGQYNQQPPPQGRGYGGPGRGVPPRQPPPRGRGGYGGPGRGGPPRQPRGYGPDPGYQEQYQGYEQPTEQGYGQRPQTAGNQGNRPQQNRILGPETPMVLAQDNAFPTFPTKKKGPRPDPLADAMAGLNMGDYVQEQQNGPMPRRPSKPGQNPRAYQDQGGYPPPQRQQPFDAGVYQNDPNYYNGPPQQQDYMQQRPGPVRSESARPERMRERQGYNTPSAPVSPVQGNFGPYQRSMTMPSNTSNDPRVPNQRVPPVPQWSEASPASGYQGPDSANYIPARPSTSTGHRPQRASPDRTNTQPNYAADALTSQQQQQQQQPHHGSQESLGDLYDDYYDHGKQENAEPRMPNFDAESPQSPQHRRDKTLHFDLSPAPNVYQQSQMNRSQPNLAAEMPGDVPAMPPLPRVPGGIGELAGGPGGRRMQGPSPPQVNHGPDGRPLQRAMTAPLQGPGPGMERPSGVNQGPAYPGQPVQSPPNAANRGPPRPEGQPVQQANPDALPQHPTPVRPGLMEGQQMGRPGQPNRPPPVRQYNGTASAADAAAAAAAAGRMPNDRPRSGPVTHDEIERLRSMIRSNPDDFKTQLVLAKKLVEAASVLADEGGRADVKTRNKNREKYIFEAHKIVKKLVSSSYPDAMFYLADCYGQGLLGLQVDPKEAFGLYQAAAKQGHAASAYRTAVCCEMGSEEGGGTRKDPMKAVQWYKRAASLGDTAAMYKMGMILLKGLLGQQRNLGEALNWLKRAAERADEENPHALHELGLLYEVQHAAGPAADRIIHDEAYAYSLFKKAAEFGYKFSQFRLGQAYEFGNLTCPIDARQSIFWYTKAAAQAEHQSELALSGWYLTGAQGILDQSDTEAYLWARKAATSEPPLPKAMYAMGYYTEVGIGCPRSLEEAKRWYGRAAAYKFPKAQERLDELKRGGVKVQKNRERLSRSNQRQNDADCVVM